MTPKLSSIIFFLYNKVIRLVFCNAMNGRGHVQGPLDLPSSPSSALSLLGALCEGAARPSSRTVVGCGICESAREVFSSARLSGVTVALAVLRIANRN